GALLGEVGETRQFMLLLVLQARLALLEDRPEDAVKIASTGMAMARHVNECPLMIAHLIALAAGQLMLDVLTDCAQHPKCPALYGLLPDLPRPPLPPNKGYEGERLAVYGTIPGLSKIAADPVGTELDAKTVEQIIRLYRGLLDDEPPRFMTLMAD